METYAEEQARAAAFYTVTIPAILAALNKIDPTGWKQEKPHEGHDYCRTAINPKGERLYFGFDRSKRKIEVSGSYGNKLNGTVWIPRDAWPKEGLPADPRPMISADKSPDQIAKDIARRLLPDYRTLRAKYLESVAASTDYRDRRDQFFAELCKLSGGRIRPRDSQWRQDAPDGERTADLRDVAGINYGDLKVSDDSARFEISVTADFARKLCKMIAAMPGKAATDDK